VDQSDALDLLDIPMDDIYDMSELDDYLSKPVEKVRDPIGWWWHHRASYPKLSKMALDYLSVPRELFHISCSSIKSSAVLLPATSTAVERVFSQGQHLLEFTRNRLSGDSIRAMLCFGDWCRKDLVDFGDILKGVRYGKRKRKRSMSVESEEPKDNK